MLTVELDTYRANVRLDGLPPKVRAALMRKRDALMLQLEAKAKELAPVGLTSKLHTAGQLRRSIFSESEDTATSVGGKVATGADTPYAKGVELGTKAHEIVATKAKALAFVMGGKQVFFKRVQHPGTTGQFFMKRAFDAMKDQIVSGLTEAAKQGAAK